MTKQITIIDPISYIPLKAQMTMIQQDKYNEIGCLSILLDNGTTIGVSYYRNKITGYTATPIDWQEVQPQSLDEVPNYDWMEIDWG